MHYVYILERKNGTLYTGMTGDLKRRIGEHKSGQTRSTNQQFSRLVFYEAFLSKKDAVRRERYLKSTKGKGTIRMMLQESLKQ